MAGITEVSTINAKEVTGDQPVIKVERNRGLEMLLLPYAVLQGSEPTDSF